MISFQISNIHIPIRLDETLHMRIDQIGNKKITKNIVELMAFTRIAFYEVF